MNVLMITSDASILRDGSAAQAALKEQAAVTNRLMVIVMNGFMNRSSPRKVSDSLWVFPTNSWLPFFKVYGAMYATRHQIFFQNRLQADIIVGGDPMSAGLAGYLIASRYKKPLHIHIERDVFSSSYLWLSIFNVFRSVFARIIVGHAYTLTVRQEKTKEALTLMNPKFSERTTVIPRYIDIDAIQAEEKDPADDLHFKYTQFRAIMLVVAPLTRGYNVRLAIRSLAEVSKYYMHIGLVIVGNGPRKWLLRYYAWQLGVADKVIFEPVRDDLVSYFKSAHLLMVPSLHDEYETTIEEAAAAGCAIISSPVGVAPSIIKHGENGFLCDPGVPSEFWNAADTLIRDPQRWSSVKANILLSIRSFMSKDKHAHLLMYKTAWEDAIRLARET